MRFCESVLKSTESYTITRQCYFCRIARSVFTQGQTDLSLECKSIVLLSEPCFQRSSFSRIRHDSRLPGSTSLLGTFSSTIIYGWFHMPDTVGTKMIMISPCLCRRVYSPLERGKYVFKSSRKQRDKECNGGESPDCNAQEEHSRLKGGLLKQGFHKQH